MSRGPGSMQTQLEQSLVDAGPRVWTPLESLLGTDKRPSAVASARRAAHALQSRGEAQIAYGLGEGSPTRSMFIRSRVWEPEHKVNENSGRALGLLHTRAWLRRYILNSPYLLYAVLARRADGVSIKWRATDFVPLSWTPKQVIADWDLFQKEAASTGYNSLWMHPTGTARVRDYDPSLVPGWRRSALTARWDVSEGGLFLRTFWQDEAFFPTRTWDARKGDALFEGGPGWLLGESRFAASSDDKALFARGFCQPGVRVEPRAWRTQRGYGIRSDVQVDRLCIDWVRAQHRRERLEVADPNQHSN